MRRTLFALMVLALVTPALADDFAPPSYRGLPLSYTAEWDQFTNGTFGTGIYTDAESSTDDSDPATYLYNGFGTHLDFDATPGWALTPAQGGGFHNPTAPATFQASVVNWVDWEPEKFLRVQMTFTDALGNGAPSILGVEGYGPVSGGEPHDELFVGNVPFDATHWYEDWIILPNPDWEAIQFALPMGTVVEQLIIDTHSTPEPATMGLLALGGMALLKRKK